MLTSFVGNFYPALIALITGPILAHALGVFGRGQVAASQAPLALMSTIATFGIPEAVTFAVAARPALARLALRNGTLILVSTGAVSTGVVVLASTWLSGGVAETREMILVAAIAVVPTLMVSALRAVAAGGQEWGRIALERVGSSTMRLVVILVLWAAGSLTPLAATIVLATMPLAGALAYIGMRALRQPPPIGLDDDAEPAKARGLTSFGTRVWIGSISGIVLSRLDQVLMTGLSSAAALGIYVVAVTVSELPLMVNSAVRDVTFASDAATPQDRRLESSARVSFLICGTIAIAVVATMWWWIPVLFGADFAASIPVAAVLLVAVVVGTPGSIAGAGLSARGRPGLRSAGMVIAGTVNIVLLVTLVPTMGAIGAAIATLVGNLLSSNFNLIVLKRFWGMRLRDFYGIRGADVAVVWRFATAWMRRRG